jgi:hypothetical protein
VEINILLTVGQKLRASVSLEYVGNGSADGPFVYCGFKPALVLIKTTSGGSWNY